MIAKALTLDGKEVDISNWIITITNIYTNKDREVKFRGTKEECEKKAYTLSNSYCEFDYRQAR